jgi:hypothetical protein
MIARPELTEAVQDCVDFAFDDARPFLKIADFLFILSEAGWSEEDLDAVKARVLNEWSRRHN